jgi:uncharacterized protein (UPF0248 family)
VTYPREVLNRIKWTKGELSDVMVTYAHRGAPDDMAVIKGEDIMELGRSFFRAGESYIPYHRIIKIENDGEEVYRA